MCRRTPRGWGAWGRSSLAATRCHAPARRFWAWRAGTGVGGWEGGIRGRGPGRLRLSRASTRTLMMLGGRGGLGLLGLGLGLGLRVRVRASLVVCMPALQSSALGSGPAPTTKTQHRTLTPPNAASGRQPPLTRGWRPLAAKGLSERAESRCLRTRVPMGGTRNRERPCHAASSVPRSPRHQMPPQGASLLSQ